MTTLSIRTAKVEDCKQIFQFITELAIYEKAEHEVITNALDIKNTLFCEQPQAHALIAEINGQAIGFAVYFFSYSTWLGRHGIYLEDLYVSPQQRGSGAGKALLKQLAKIAVEKGCGRVEWSVLDWNEPAIQFYKSLRAEPKDGWTVYRLAGDALNSFANID